MNDADDLELRRQLRGMAGDVTDVEGASTRVHARVRQVRRRRAAATTGAAALLLVGGVALAATRTTNDERISTASPSVDDTDAPATTVGPSTTITIAITTAPPVTSTTAPSSTTAAPTTSVDDDTATVPSTVPASVPTGLAPTTTSGRGSEPHTTAPANTSPTVTAAPTTPTTHAAPSSPSTSVAPTTSPSTPPSSGPQTFSATGGSVVVRVDAGRLVLVSITPAAGFAEDERNVGDREIEIRFASSTLRSTITLRLEGGIVTKSTVDKAHGESGPDTSNDTSGNSGSGSGD